MVWLVLILIFVGVLIGPGMWVKHIMRKYSEPPDRYRESGTGGALARHLLDRLKLTEVGVEATVEGDHYDPEARTVRLSRENFDGTSLTAITVAAHEVGHAVQHDRGERLFALRFRLAKVASVTGKIGSAFLLIAPLIMVLTRVPHAGLLLFAVGLCTMAIGSVVHLITLPVEFDASFNKALPILQTGGYLIEGDLPHANRILRAAALTYVAGSLASLLSVWRWLRILRS